MDAMTIRALSILACVLLAGPGSAEAQQQLFACSKICWDPAASGATCSKILATQIELTSYIWAVQHGIIAKGKGLTFSLDLNTPWPSCASETAARHSFSVSGYVGVQSVTSYTDRDSRNRRRERSKESALLHRSVREMKSWSG